MADAIPWDLYFHHGEDETERASSAREHEADHKTGTVARHFSPCKTDPDAAAPRPSQ